MFGGFMLFQKKASVVSAIGFLILLALPLSAQNASLVGTIKDQQGGAVPNATVTLTSQDTGVSQSAATDTGGNYEFPTVRPGSYKLKAEQKGFQTYSQSGIVLAVDGRLRVDPVLQVGDISTVISVEALPATVSTESSSLGSVVDNRKIVEIPL